MPVTLEQHTTVTMRITFMLRLWENILRCSIAQKAYDGPVSPKQLLTRYYFEYFVKTSRGLYTGSMWASCYQRLTIWVYIRNRDEHGRATCQWCYILLYRVWIFIPKGDGCITWSDHCCMIIVNWYSAICVQIKWRSALSEPISVHKGTRQTGLSLPFLFILFLSISY